MFKKILVALDRSSEASVILDSALAIAKVESSEILLVHFIDWQMQDVSPWIGIGTLYDVDLSGERYDWSRQHLKKEVEIANDWLKTMAEKANQSGITCSYECHVGNCNLGISDRAKDWNADVLVIGRRGRKNISEMLLGSVSNYVIHHAPCSILVVQGSEVVEADSNELSVVNKAGD
ncbi:MAG: universal stress protein [Cyanobacteria bacterium P01_A01_bin.83]